MSASEHYRYVAHRRFVEAGRRLLAKPYQPDLQGFEALLQVAEDLIVLRAASQARQEEYYGKYVHLEDALSGLVEVIDKAGLLNLANGVQLGATSWYVKASDAMEYARSALGRDSDASLAEDPKGLSGEAVAARAEGIAQ